MTMFVYARMTSLPVFRQTFGYARLVFQTNLRDSESIADPLYFPKLEKCSLNSQHNKDGDEDGPNPSTTLGPTATVRTSNTKKGDEGENSSFFC